MTVSPIRHLRTAALRPPLAAELHGLASSALLDDSSLNLPGPGSADSIHFRVPADIFTLDINAHLGSTLAVQVQQNGPIPRAPQISTLVHDRRPPAVGDP
jgi:hypothetical protein